MTLFFIGAINGIVLGALLVTWLLLLTTLHQQTKAPARRPDERNGQ